MHFTTDVNYLYRDGSPVHKSQDYRPHGSTRFRNGPLVQNETVKSLPELYTHREKCCGCSACVYLCPVDAISMEPDEEGFDYPVIDASICIRCYKCMDACAFK